LKKKLFLIARNQKQCQRLSYGFFFFILIETIFCEIKLAYDTKLRYFRFVHKIYTSIQYSLQTYIHGAAPTNTAIKASVAHGENVTLFLFKNRFKEYFRWNWVSVTVRSTFLASLRVALTVAHKYSTSYYSLNRDLEKMKIPMGSMRCLRWGLKPYQSKKILREIPIFREIPIMRDIPIMREFPILREIPMSRKVPSGEKSASQPLFDILLWLIDILLLLL